jgi:hypothetical protein
VPCLKRKRATRPLKQSQFEAAETTEATGLFASPWPRMIHAETELPRRFVALHRTSIENWLEAAKPGVASTYQVMGEPSHCCGAIHVSAGDAEVSGRLGTSTTRSCHRFASVFARPVVPASRFRPAANFRASRRPRFLALARSDHFWLRDPRRFLAGRLALARRLTSGFSAAAWSHRTQYSSAALRAASAVVR